MKNIISWTLGVFLFATPISAFAQTVGTSQNDVLINLLQQLIVVLSQELQELLVQKSSTTPLFGSTVQNTAQVSTTTVITPYVQVVTNSPQAAKDHFFITIKPVGSDGNIDHSAVVDVVSDAPWWFPHGVQACDGCKIKLNTPFDAGVPSDAANYTFTATWEQQATSTSQSISVTQ